MMTSRRRTCLGIGACCRRPQVARQYEYSDTLLQRSSEALSNETGVNIDEEMTSLLELERAYQASSRLITTIDNMLKTLLATGN